MKQLSPARRDALREYFLSVVRDLIQRGVIRRSKGQSLEAILRIEAKTVLGEVSEDLRSIATEMGFGLINGIGSLIGGLLSGRRG